MTPEQNPFPQEPHVERPDKVKAEPDLVYCFRDATRPCNAACAAYLGLGEEPADRRMPKNVARCAVLASNHRVGKYLGILAERVTAAVKTYEINDLDRKAGR